MEGNQNKWAVAVSAAVLIGACGIGIWAAKQIQLSTAEIPTQTENHSLQQSQANGQTSDLMGDIGRALHQQGVQWMTVSWPTQSQQGVVAFPYDEATEQEPQGTTIPALLELLAEAGGTVQQDVRWEQDKAQWQISLMTTEGRRCLIWPDGAGRVVLSWDGELWYVQPKEGWLAQVEALLPQPNADWATQHLEGYTPDDLYTLYSYGDGVWVFEMTEEERRSFVASHRNREVTFTAEIMADTHLGWEQVYLLSTYGVSKGEMAQLSPCVADMLTAYNNDVVEAVTHNGVTEDEWSYAISLMDWQYSCKQLLLRAADAWQDAQT